MLPSAERRPVAARCYLTLWNWGIAAVGEGREACRGIPVFAPTVISNSTSTVQRSNSTSTVQRQTLISQISLVDAVTTKRRKASLLDALDVAAEAFRS